MCAFEEKVMSAKVVAMDRFLAIDEMLSMLRRRLVVFGLVAVLGSVLSLFYALSLPRLYETSAVIQIESSAVSDSLVTSQTSSRALQQLQRTEQRLMARDHLLEMIQEFDLFSDLPNATNTDKVYLLRLATNIEQVINPNLQWRTDVSPTALTITVRLGDPEQVAQVANRFVASVLAQNKMRREERVRDTLQFFESEESRVGQEIAELDAEIAVFKRANASALPEAVAGKRVQLANLDESDLVLEQQWIELTSGPVEDRRASITQKITLIEQQRAAIAERRNAIAASIKSAPQIEKTYNNLSRQLGLLEEQYTIITRHRAEAEMGQMLEDSRQSENYEVLEMAQVPDKPIAPSRKKVLMMGVVASFGAAFVLIYLLENWNPVIRSAAQMERQLNMRPVVSIPNIETGVELTRRWILKTMAIVFAIAAIAVALTLVNTHVVELASLIDTGWISKLASK